MFWIYFVRPLESLAEGWQFKLPVAVVLTYMWSAVREVIGLYADLLALPTFLLGMASLAFIFDFLTAILRAYREKGIKGIQFIKFRQLLIKAAEWALVIGVASNIASGAEQAAAEWLSLFGHVDAIAVFWLTIQDGWSSLKNIKGEDTALLWVEGAMDLANGRLSLDQLDKSSDE